MPGALSATTVWTVSGPGVGVDDDAGPIAVVVDDTVLDGFRDRHLEERPVHDAVVGVVRESCADNEANVEQVEMGETLPEQDRIEAGVPGSHSVRDSPRGSGEHHRRERGGDLVRVPPDGGDRPRWI